MTQFHFHEKKNFLTLIKKNAYIDNYNKKF